jgi:hypothetical protein
MLTNEKVTLFRYSPDMDDYEPVGTVDAWVFAKKAITGSVNGDENSDVIHIRIPYDAVDDIKVGDFVRIGNPGTDPDDMSDCRKIVRVSNNRFGTVPHLHLEV